MPEIGTSGSGDSRSCISVSVRSANFIGIISPRLRFDFGLCRLALDFFRQAVRKRRVSVHAPGRLKRSSDCVPSAHSFWAGAEETPADGLFNECKRLLGFARFRLGCLRTELHRC